jgi:hypothetical protein
LIPLALVFTGGANARTGKPNPVAGAGSYCRAMLDLGASLIRPNRRLARGLACTLVVLGVAGLIPQAAAAKPAQDENEALRAELASLRKRIEDLEAHQAIRTEAVVTAAPAQPSAPILLTPAAPAPPPSPALATGYLQPFGTATQLRLSGHIRLGAYKDLKDNLNGYKFRAGDIHPRGDPRRAQRGDMQAQLRLSRIAVESRTPTRFGDLRTTLAVDFAGAEPKTYQAEALQNNGYHLRLHQAFATLGPFDLGGVASEVLVGQTWSNFLDDPDTAESLDPSGPAGVPSERQAQIRYTARFGRHAVSVAAENPIGEYQLPGTVTASNVNNTSTTNRVPDLSLKYEVEAGWGRAQASGLVRFFSLRDGLGREGSATGYGLILGGTLNLPGRDKVGGQLWAGEGVGKYVPDEFGVPNGFAVLVNGADLRVETQPTWGGSLWLRHYWAREWRSNFALGYSRQGYADFIVAAPDQAPKLLTGHVNLIYSPVPAVDFGVELEYGRKTFRRSLELDDADALRLGVSTRVKFN